MWGSRVGLTVYVCVVGATLTLVVRARAGAGGPPACSRLHAAYAYTENGEERPERAVSVYGKERNVSVYWDSGGGGAGRAAAALFVALARHGLRYSAQRLHLRRASGDLCHLADTKKTDCQNVDTSETIYNEIVLAPAMRWNLQSCKALEMCEEDIFGLVAPRLVVTGPGAAPAALRLHVRLGERARTIPRCRDAAQWTFYRNQAHLSDCGFYLNQSLSHALLLYLPSWESTAIELDQRIKNESLFIGLGKLVNVHVSMMEFMLYWQSYQNFSYLFLDFDIWEDEPSVLPVEPPPSALDVFPATLDSTSSLRAANLVVLRQLAPQLLNSFQKFSPKPRHLREILELEVTSIKYTKYPDESSIMEAACEWALNNTLTFKSWLKSSGQRYWILVFLCKNDPHNEDYKKVIRIVEKEHNSEIYYDIRTEIDCTSESEMNSELVRVANSKSWSTLIGVLGSGAGAKQVAEYGAMTETALVVYDAPARGVRLAPAVRAVAGTASNLAMALAHFFVVNKWSRIGVISEDSELANDFFEVLDSDEKLKLRQIRLPKKVEPADIIRELQTLKTAGARIIFINGYPLFAEMILCAAVELNMIPDEGYAWIVREWRSVNITCSKEHVDVGKMEHFTISYWWRGNPVLSSKSKRETKTKHSGVRKKLDRLWEGRAWPPLAAPLADAATLLATCFKAYEKNYARSFFDIHGDGAGRLLMQSIDKLKPIQGVTQEMRYFQGAHVRPMVYLYRWRGERPRLLKQWQIQNGSIINITHFDNIYDNDPPSDGTAFCLTSTSGDDFEPFCHDYVWLATGICLFLTFMVIFIAWKIRFDRLMRKDSILKAQLLAERTFVSAGLSNHQVDRGALEIYYNYNLGEGCFGRVWYGVLRAPDRLPISVAVKEIRDDIAPAEERELLREAITLAALEHEHVVRLVGVCNTGGPLLMLMEYAFFGDLQKYLCQRRHLVENAGDATDDANEATHVSAIALTRLGMEAASALEYLSLERIVHRDVRASNCLVDAHRSLKLADFGLARKTGNGSNGDIEEYASQRHRFLPVLWMAPESLERGVFTAASDAWALGVLLLEVATLGARPYGDWPTQRVLRYVLAGGRPPLPPDIHCNTRSLVRRCWRRAPGERLTAAAAARELRATPDLLRPSLLAPDMPPDHRRPLYDD